MIADRLAIFAQGTAVMYFLLGGIYFIFTAKNNRLKRILGVVLLYWLMLSIKDLYFVLYKIHKSFFVESMVVSVDATAIPTCLFLIMELLKPGWLTLKRILYCELPFFLFIILYGFTESILIFKASLVFGIIFILVSIFVISLKLPFYSKRLREKYRNDEVANIMRLLKIFSLFIILSAIWFATSVSFSSLFDTIYYFSSGILWVLIGYYVSLYQPESIVSDKLMASEGYSVEQRDFKVILNNLFEEEKIYLNPMLKLTDVTDMLKTNRTYLSEFLNKEMKTSFYDLVNDYRIEYASTLLTSVENDNLTIESLALESGFNSITTFRRVFRKKYNCSPNEFRKNLR